MGTGWGTGSSRSPPVGSRIPNSESWHLTSLPAPSLSRQIWHEYTFATDTSVPQGALVFRDQSESTATVRGAGISERETGAKWPFSNEAATKGLRFSWRDAGPGRVEVQGTQGCKERARMERGIAPQGTCLSLLITGWPWILPSAERDGHESTHTIKWKSGTGVPASLSLPLAFPLHTHFNRLAPASFWLPISCFPAHSSKALSSQDQRKLSLLTHFFKTTSQLG